MRKIFVITILCTIFALVSCTEAGREGSNKKNNTNNKSREEVVENNSASTTNEVNDSTGDATESMQAEEIEVKKPDVIKDRIVEEIPVPENKILQDPDDNHKAIVKALNSGLNVRNYDKNLKFTEANIKKASEIIVSKVKELFNIELEYKLDSLKNLDHILFKLYSKGMPKEKIAIFGFGSYLSQVIQRDLGGKPYYNKDFNKIDMDYKVYSYNERIDLSVLVFPYTMVVKKILGDLEDEYTVKDISALINNMLSDKLLPKTIVLGNDLEYFGSKMKLQLPGYLEQKKLMELEIKKDIKGYEKELDAMFERHKWDYDFLKLIAQWFAEVPLNNYSKSAATWKQRILINETDNDSRVNYALMIFEDQRFKKERDIELIKDGVSELSTALKEYGDRPLPWGIMGELKMYLGNNDEAKEAFNKVLEIEPKFNLSDEAKKFME